MNFLEFLKYISVIVASCTAIVASCTAIYGIGSWRREYRGKKRSDLAEEALCLFYEARDAIQHIRNPFSHGGEGSTRKSDENETPEQKEAYDRAYVLIERFNTHIDLFNKIRSIRYRFMAQFGTDAGKPFEDFKKILNEIYVSAQTLGSLWVEQFRSFQTGRHVSQNNDLIRKQENIFWAGLPEEDPIKSKVEGCIKDIEQICRSII